MTSENQSKFLSGTPYETEGRLPRKDGKYRWFLLRYNPVRDQQGRVIRWYVAATDIEDRKQAEQRLQNGDGQRTDRARRSQTITALLASVCQCELRRCSTRLDRIRIVRP